MAKFWSKYGFPTVTGGILAVTLVAGAMMIAPANADIEAQKIEIAALTEQLRDASGAAQSAADASVADLLGGQLDRIASDSAVIKGLADVAFTWSSHEEYEDARAKIQRVYGLGEGSSLLESFLPPAPVTTDSLGNEYPYIDASGLNSSVADMRTHLLSVDGVDYRYMALVTVLGNSLDGAAASSNTSVILVTVDGDGNLKDVSGFASASQARNSG